jgi:hypothetical protein
VFEAFNDPWLDTSDKWEVAVYLLFECFEEISDIEDAVREGFDINEAARQITWFLQPGTGSGGDGNDRHPKLYDWEQDEQMIFSAVNKVAHTELREAEYVHWWTFMGYFNEIREGLFSEVVGIRNKLARGKKLEKHEREFYRHNRELINLRKPMTEDEQKEHDELKELMEEVIG